MTQSHLASSSWTNSLIYMASPMLAVRLSVDKAPNTRASGE